MAEPVSYTHLDVYKRQGLWGAGVINLMLVIGLLYIPHFSRVAYSSTLQVRKMEYVESDLSIGAAPSAIMWKAIFPNIISVLIVQVSTTISNAILLESGLSFLGLGVQDVYKRQILHRHDNEDECGYGNGRRVYFHGPGFNR